MPEAQKDIHFPKAGLDNGCPFSRQTNRPVGPDNEYARTSREAVNVRAYDFSLLRLRGGSRPGTIKYLPTQPAGVTWVVQELNSIVIVGGDVSQTSQSGRAVVLVAVSQGQVFTAQPGATAWTPAVNNTGRAQPLNYSGIMFSAANSQVLYFADGVNYTKYIPLTNSLENWVAGTQDLDGNAITSVLPVDRAGNTPRLICTWRGRTVLSGLTFDSQNWFMSAVGDPNNFDYSPTSQTATQAVAGNNSPLGLVGDTIMSLCPYNDDTLIFFGSNSIYILRGDPLAGGQLDRVSDIVGGTWGICWTKDPAGTVYFCSNRMGVYSMVPGQQPQRISGAIESLLLNINTGNNSIRLQWDDRLQGFHLFVTPLDAQSASTHFFWEQRTQGWWTDRFTSTGHDPLCCLIYDGNTPNDRVPLLGCWDGYVRAINPTATTDDGVPINSYVVIGPFITKDFDEIMMREIQGILGMHSGDVTWEIFAGNTAEEALDLPAVCSGTFSAGVGFTESVRVAARAIYLKLSSSSAWQMETIRTMLATQGKVRQRGKGQGH